MVCHIFVLKPLSPVGSGKCIIEVSFAVPVVRVLVSLLPVVNVCYSHFICHTSHKRLGISLASGKCVLFNLLYRSQDSSVCCTGHKSVGISLATHESVGISLASGKCVLFEVSFSVPIARVLVSVLPLVNLYYLKFHLPYPLRECWHLSCQW